MSVYCSADLNDPVELLLLLSVSRSLELELSESEELKRSSNVPMNEVISTLTLAGLTCRTFSRKLMFSKIYKGNSWVLRKYQSLFI